MASRSGRGPRVCPSSRRPPARLGGPGRRAGRRIRGRGRAARRSGPCRRGRAGRPTRRRPRPAPPKPSVPSDAHRRTTGACPPGTADAAARPLGGHIRPPPTRRPARLLACRRRLVFGHGREDRQPRRRGERPGRRIARHDRELLVVRQRVARQQPEVDPRGRHARAVRQDDRDPGPRRRPGSGPRPR